MHGMMNIAPLEPDEGTIEVNDTGRSLLLCVLINVVD